jgi:beta-glucanase (GH16 family)
MGALATFLFFWRSTYTHPATPTTTHAALSQQATPAPLPTTTAAPQKTVTPKVRETTVANPIATPKNFQVMDQFAGNTLNNALWEAVTLPKSYRNNEEQDYSPSQVRVANGSLQITATRDPQGQWHSGEVHSKWNYTYGDFEVRLALSSTAAGVWPAAWLLATTDQWPNGGEIDIFESINSEPNVFGTLHAGGSNGHWQLQNYASGIDVTKFHTYKISKKPGSISWWVDGAKQAEWSQSQTPPGGVWPFETHRNFGVLNLAIGGNWPGSSNATTPSAVTMYVDYFSVKNGL